MNDADTFVATSRVKGAEGTYELEFSLTKDSFTVDYTIYDAEPLGLQPELKGTDITFHKNLQCGDLISPSRSPLSRTDTRSLRIGFA